MYSVRGRTRLKEVVRRNPKHGPEKGRYIIRSEHRKQLTDFINRIKQDPGIELVDVIGPAGQPHTIVAAMAHEKARFLEQDLILSKPPMAIELDRPLSLFDIEGRDKT